MKEEIKIKGSELINISCTRNILNQMINCVCKIKINKNNETEINNNEEEIMNNEEEINNNEAEIINKPAYGTGFFCKLPLNENKDINCLLTNYHVLNEKYFEENKEINILLNDDSEAKKINLNIKRIIYYNKKFDTTIIELKDEDNIKEFLELDNNIFKDNEDTFYKGESIYIIQYPNGKEACVSYGMLNKINNHNIIHICSTEYGSSGSPILNLKNNKVIGIHKGTPDYTKNYNHGTLLKYPLNDFIDKNKRKNNITGEIYINKDNINKDIRIINSFENVKREGKWKDDKDDYLYENEEEIKENLEIKINEKKIEFTYYNKFKEEGKYLIEYSFKNNLTKINHIFYGCNLLINLNLSKFNTQNVTNMSGMFWGCNSLRHLKLLNFNTQNVTDMSRMFCDCNSLKNLNLSNFNTQHLTDMKFMFSHCYSLTNLNLSNFNTQNIRDMDGIFYGCKSLKKEKIITKDKKILNKFLY